MSHYRCRGWNWGNVAKRFASEGYHAVLVRRGDKAGLDRLVGEIEAEGGSATGFMLNAVEEGSIERLVEGIETNIGPIEVAVFNLGAQIGNRALANTMLKAFEIGWRMATFGLFRLAVVLFRSMAKWGKGTLLVTSATAAVRGNEGQHSHAARWGDAACSANPSTPSSRPRAFTSRTSSLTAPSMRPTRSARCWDPSVTSS